jgi:TonB-like protein
MQAGISKEGLLEYVRVQSGDPTRTVAATDAVKKRKYKPLVLTGQTLPFETQVTVTFKLPIK